MQSDFFRSLKDKTSHVPSRALDQAILAQARRRLLPSPRLPARWRTALVPITALALLVVWFQLAPAVLPGGMLAESPEMLKHMEEVELWVEVADLSEEEWHLVATGDT